MSISSKPTSGVGVLPRSISLGQPVGYRSELTTRSQYFKYRIAFRPPPADGTMCHP